MTEYLGNISYNPLDFFQDLHNKWLRFLETGWAFCAFPVRDCEMVTVCVSLERVVYVSAGQCPALLCCFVCGLEGCESTVIDAAVSIRALSQA